MCSKEHHNSNLGSDSWLSPWSPCGTATSGAQCEECGTAVECTPVPCTSEAISALLWLGRRGSRRAGPSDRREAEQFLWGEGEVVSKPYPGCFKIDEVEALRRTRQPGIRRASRSAGSSVDKQSSGCRHATAGASPRKGMM